MRKQFRTTLATAAAFALTGGLLVAAAGSAAAAPSGLQGDFDGDGFQDVAVTAPYASVNGQTGAGAVTILYGSPSGAGASRIQTLTQDSAGIPGAAEKDDNFAWSETAGDFNGDGYADLAVGVPGEDAGTDADGGTVTLVYGSATGLSGGGTVFDPARTTHDLFGRAVVAGDYDGDGRDDLAVASDLNTVDVFEGAFTEAGAEARHYTVTAPILPVKGPDIFNLTAGDVNGDHRTDLLVDGYENDSTGDIAFNANYYLPGSASGVTRTGSRKLPPGIITDIGDTNGDGFGDIVVGVQWDSGEDSPGLAKGGAVSLVYGAASGPDGGSLVIDQNTPGVPGSAEAGDLFGYELSLGDVDGDGFEDLAIGMPGEDLPGGADAGMVAVLYGAVDGFRSTGAQTIEQDTPGVPGSSEAGDGFGGEVFLTDTTGDGKADLTVGVPWENANDGQVVAFESDGTALSTTGRGIGLTAAGISAEGTPFFGANATG